MPKRKRSAQESVEEKFATFRKELFRALKTAKGYERQQQAKRLRNSSDMPEKVQRLEREIAVLKSLDLHQAAHAHLVSALLRLKPVAASPNLPDEIRSGPPRPDISEEELVTLNNVTSLLCNRKEIRAVMDRAIPSICSSLGVEVPERRRGGKAAKSDECRGQEDQPADRPASVAAVAASKVERGEPPRSEKPRGRPVQDTEDAGEEEAISRYYEAMLGGSSDEDGSEPGSDEEEDPMAITSDEEEEEEEEGDPMAITSDEEDELGGVGSDGEEEWEGLGEDPGHGPSGGPHGVAVPGESSAAEESSSDEGLSVPASPPRKRVAKAGTAREPAAKRSGADSSFLPTLMGGYISGSESASDVDAAPPRKNRRGQRARQAIWEKKFKDKAKHLHKEGKDQGWDPRRGAVDGTAKPWKHGIRNPLDRAPARQAQPQGANSEPLKPRQGARRPQESTGPLHPSWEARKKAKEKQETAVFQGKKITFD